MAKQNLDDADIDILLEQMRGKAMPLGVRTDALAKIGPLSRLLNRTVQLTGRDRLCPALAGE